MSIIELYSNTQISGLSYTGVCTDGVNLYLPKYSQSQALNYIALFNLNTREAPTPLVEGFDQLLGGICIVKNKLYFTDNKSLNNGILYSYDLINSTLVQLYSSNTLFNQSLCTDGKSLYFCLDGHVLKYDSLEPGGNTTTLVTFSETPISICTDGNNLYLYVNNTVIKYTSVSGGGTSEVLISGFSITGLSTDGSNLYYCKPFSVEKYNSLQPGGETSVIVSGYYNPDSTCVYGDDVYIIAFEYILKYTSAVIPCFLSFTKILTMNPDNLEGEEEYKVISEIKKGDFVKGLLSQKPVCVTHCGSSEIDMKNLSSYNFPRHIPKGIFGNNKPFEDLYMSGGHRLLVLDPSDKTYLRIPVCYFENLREIRDAEEIIKLTKEKVPKYYHIELEDTTEGVLAEGVSVESLEKGFWDDRIFTENT